MIEPTTLIAASVAALASLSSLIVNIFVKKRVELREAQRASLEPVVVELGSLLYSVVAMSKRLGLSKNDDKQVCKSFYEKVNEIMLKV